jgi:Spermine/spermidine synthase domain
MPSRVSIRRLHAVRLAGYSCLILFIELGLIRYIAAYVRVFGFFVNFVLIATFLGMGVGLLRAARGRPVGAWMAPAALVALFAGVKLFSVLTIRVLHRKDEMLWAIIPPGRHEVGIVPAVLVLFALSTFVFIPLGSGLALEFRRFRALAAYSLDIAGSLTGVLAFGAMSWAEYPPIVWFTVAFAGWVALSIDPRRGLRHARPLVLAPAALGALGLILWTRQATSFGVERWSHYYRVTEDDTRGALRCINVNGMLHQCMVDFRRSPDLAAAYLWPYRFVGRVDTALVVGAGSGNDVAVLLHRGARYIDAVEIDPVIQSIGAAQHPLRPYDDPRVHVHITDARGFLRTTRHHYDVITMGTLDSQTLLSGMTSVRLDNYVYTRQSFQAAHDRLAPGGSLVAYHMSPLSSIEAKVYQLAAVTFHQLPRVDTTFKQLFNLTLVAGAGAGAQSIDSVPTTLTENVELPTDDWPYLYLAHQTVPLHYVIALGGVLAIAVALIALALAGGPGGPASRPALALGARDVALFGTGLGFLLLESKSVTEMSLLFGATWTVNLLVFAAILAVIGVANMLVARLDARVLPRLFGALIAALAIAYAVPADALLGLTTVGQWVIGAGLVALPIFFAALIFGLLFRDHANPARGLGVNLLGAIVGGLLEYAAMAVGVKTLYLIAAVAYLGTLLAVLRLRDVAGARSASRVVPADFGHDASPLVDGARWRR